MAAHPFGHYLIRFRHMCLLSQQMLATAAGVERSAIARWENGDRKIGEPCFRRICQALSDPAVSAPEAPIGYYEQVLLAESSGHPVDLCVNSASSVTS